MFPHAALFIFTIVYYSLSHRCTTSIITVSPEFIFRAATCCCSHWISLPVDCWKCCEEGLRQLGASSPEGGVWQIRWRQRGGQDQVCGWNSTGNYVRQDLLLLLQPFLSKKVFLIQSCIPSWPFLTIIWMSLFFLHGWQTGSLRSDCYFQSILITEHLHTIVWLYYTSISTPCETPS